MVEEKSEVRLDNLELPMTQLADGTPVLRFYWLDAYEAENARSGIVYLFGKVCFCRRL